MHRILTGYGDLKITPHAALVVKGEREFYATRTTYSMQLCEFLVSHIVLTDNAYAIPQRSAAVAASGRSESRATPKSSEVAGSGVLWRRLTCGKLRGVCMCHFCLP